jgi:hypothetical protein
VAERAAVTIASADRERVRSSLPDNASKWSKSDFAQASNVVGLMLDQAVAVGTFSINKRTPAWEKYWIDSEAIKRKIQNQDRKPAAFVRAPNFLRFHLMGGASSLVFGHARFRTRSRQSSSTPQVALRFPTTSSSTTTFRVRRTTTCFAP